MLSIVASANAAAFFARKSCDNRVKSFPLKHRQKRTLTAFSYNCVAFPVPFSTAAINNRRAVVNAHTIPELALAIIVTVALSIRLRGHSQVLIEVSSIGFVSENGLIDRLMVQRHFYTSFQIAGNLLWAQILANQLFNHVSDTIRNLDRLMCLAATPTGKLLGLLGPVATQTTVPLQLSTDGRSTSIPG